MNKFSLFKYIYSFLQSTTFLLLFAYTLLGLVVMAPYAVTKLQGSYHPRELQTIFWYMCYSMFIYLALPVLFVKLLFNESLRDYGLKLPENKKTALMLIILTLLIVMPYILYFATRKEFQHSYSYAGMDPFKFFFVQGVFTPFYYLSEEFFFRGFLFIGLWKRVKWHSFWITDILFTYAHLTKPGLEFLFAIPVSVIFNFITLKTKSIYPALFVHSTIGVVMNVVVTYSLI